MLPQGTAFPVLHQLMKKRIQKLGGDCCCYVILPSHPPVESFADCLNLVLMPLVKSVCGLACVVPNVLHRKAGYKKVFDLGFRGPRYEPQPGVGHPK